MEKMDPSPRAASQIVPGGIAALRLTEKGGEGRAQEQLKLMCKPTVLTPPIYLPIALPSRAVATGPAPHTVARDQYPGTLP